jgi:hypothetical protein
VTKNWFTADLSAEAASAASVFAKADVAQLAERVLGKDEVTSSILVIGSRLRSAEVWPVESQTKASFVWAGCEDSRVTELNEGCPRRERERGH